MIKAAIIAAVLEFEDRTGDRVDWVDIVRTGKPVGFLRDECDKITVVFKMESVDGDNIESGPIDDGEDSSDDG